VKNSVIFSTRDSTVRQTHKTGTKNSTYYAMSNHYQIMVLTKRNRG